MNKLILCLISSKQPSSYFCSTVCTYGVPVSLVTVAWIKAEPLSLSHSDAHETKNLTEALRWYKLSTKQFMGMKTI